MIGVPAALVVIRYVGRVAGRCGRRPSGPARQPWDGRARCLLRLPLQRLFLTERSGMLVNAAGGRARKLGGATGRRAAARRWLGGKEPGFCCDRPPPLGGVWLDEGNAAWCWLHPARGGTAGRFWLIGDDSATPLLTKLCEHDADDCWHPLNGEFPSTALSLLLLALSGVLAAGSSRCYLFSAPVPKKKRRRLGKLSA